jgi:hypothetical protein
VIPHVKGWSKVFSGESLLLYPPEGPGVGGIRYRERVRPLLGASLVVEELLARFPQFQGAAPNRPEMLITAEGEYAAHVVVGGVVDGKPAQRDVGLVFGDDYYALISSLCVVEHKFAEFSQLVRLLVRLDAHALGVRRRRFLYTPPPGWHAQARGFTTEWSPLDFPRVPNLIHVFPANPLPEDPRIVLDQMLAEDAANGFELEAMRGPEPIASLHGLGGLAWNIVGHFGRKPRSHRDLVVFKDDRFLYSLRLETMQEERSVERAIFLELVRSVHPIPAPTATEPQKVGTVVEHWAL